MGITALHAGLGVVRPDNQQSKPAQVQQEPAAAKAAAASEADADGAPAQRVLPAEETQGDNTPRDASESRNPFERVNILV
jgi:hypothetical protein